MIRRISVDANWRERSILAGKAHVVKIGPYAQPIKMSAHERSPRDAGVSCQARLS